MKDQKETVENLWWWMNLGRGLEAIKSVGSGGQGRPTSTFSSELIGWAEPHPKNARQAASYECIEATAALI